MKTIGVIGLGSIGLRHAKNLIEMGYHVVGYDPDTSRDHALLMAGGELADSSIIKGIDAAVIASPSAYHTTHLQQCIDHGVPCLVEKPITLDHPEILELILKYAAKNNVPVMTGFNLRFHPLAILAKRKMNTALGIPDIAHFSVLQKSTKPEYLRDGVALNWAIHEIDLALYLLGPADVLSASGDNNSIEAVLEHNCGCHTTIRSDYVTEPEVREFHIAWRGGGFKANLVSSPEQWDQVYKDEMAWFLGSIDPDTVSGTPYYGASGEEGLEAVMIALEINRLAGI